MPTELRRPDDPEFFVCRECGEEFAAEYYQSRRFGGERRHPACIPCRRRSALSYSKRQIASHLACGAFHWELTILRCSRDNAWLSNREVWEQLLDEAGKL